MPHVPLAAGLLAAALSAAIVAGGPPARADRTDAAMARSNARANEAAATRAAAGVDRTSHPGASGTPERAQAAPRGVSPHAGRLPRSALRATVAPQQPTFRLVTQVVPIYATVTDAEGRLVPDLAREDFQVFDNGKPQEITQFSNETQPISVVVMLDTSASMTVNLELVKRAAEQFLIRLLPEDRGMVGAFNDKIQFASELTGDRDALVGALNDLQFGNPTRLYDAIDASLDELRGLEGRRVILVLTDGDDTASRVGFGHVQARARAEDVMIYAIGLESELVIDGRRIRTRPDRGLKRLAEETGGGYFELDKTAELGATFTRVAQELHSQYVLGFSPAVLDGKVHRLETRVTKAGLTVRARKSYLAAPDRSPATPGRP
jgi:Ca-activated chloride channel family protein